VEKVVFLKYNLKAIGYDLITLSDIRLTTLNCHGWCAGSESDTSCSDCDEEKKNNGVTKYLKKVNGDCECDSWMHNKYEVKYELAYLVYQCFSCNNVICKSHMAWAKRHVSSCYKSRMLCKY